MGEHNAHPYQREETRMKYYEIHVTYGPSDSDGYSIVVAIENGDEEAAVEKAINNGMFEEICDIDNIDYVEELSEEEYMQITSK